MPDVVVLLLVQILTSSNRLNLASALIHLELVQQVEGVFRALFWEEDIVFMGPEEVVIEYHLVDGATHDAVVTTSPDHVVSLG